MTKLKQFLEQNPFWWDQKIVIKIDGAPRFIYDGEYGLMPLKHVLSWGEYYVKRIDFPSVDHGGPQDIVVIILYEQEGV